MSERVEKQEEPDWLYRPVKGERAKGLVSSLHEKCLGYKPAICFFKKVMKNCTTLCMNLPLSTSSIRAWITLTPWKRVAWPKVFFIGKMKKKFNCWTLFKKFAFQVWKFTEPKIKLFGIGKAFFCNIATTALPQVSRPSNHSIISRTKLWKQTRMFWFTKWSFCGSFFLARRRMKRSLIFIWAPHSGLRTYTPSFLWLHTVTDNSCFTDFRE